MANLLPPQEQKRMRAHVRSRFIATGSLVAIVCGVVALLALLPVYAIIRGAGDSSEGPAVQGGLSQEEDREEIARARLLLRDLKPVTVVATSSLEMLADIFKARPKGTIITSIFFDRGEEGVITLAGTSASREDITAYRDLLAKDARYKSVTVPIGVLAGTAGKAFTLTITGSF